MPFGLSDIFSALSPRRPRSDPPPPPPQNNPIHLSSPPSHAISDQRRRAEASGVRDASLSIASSSVAPDGQFDGFVESAQLNPNHAAEGYRPSQHQPTVRSLLRKTIPSLRPGMSRLSGNGKPTHKDPAESRLFPTFGPPNGGGVPIVPGEKSKRTKPGQNFSHKPIDKISQRARDSGPVPARGRPKQNGGNQKYATLNISDDSFERPQKRPRRDNPNAPPHGRTINVSDDDIMEQAAPPSEVSLSSFLSPSPSRNPSKGKKGQGPRRGSTNETHDVEKMIRVSRSQSSPKHGPQKQRHYSPDDDQIESFTENAAKQRRSFADQDVDPLDLSHESKYEVLKSETKKDEETSLERNRATSPPLQSRFIAANGKRRNSDACESPDELQGEATVAPAPTSLDERPRKKKTKGKKSGAEGRAGPANRQRSSPADISPTKFISSGQKKQKNKRPNPKKDPPPSNPPPSNLKVFQTALFRAGVIEHMASDDKAIEMHVDDTSITLAGYAVEIPRIKILDLLYGKRPSRKVRLRFPKSEDMATWADIELSSLEEKEEFCSLILGQNNGVKPQEKEDVWMDGSFDRNKRLAIKYANTPTRPCTESVVEQIPETKPEVVKRKKLVASLQDDSKNTNEPHEPQEDTKPATADSSDEIPDPTTHSHPSRSDKDDGVEIPVKKFTGNPPATNRETRSMARRAPQSLDLCDDDEEAAEEIIENLEYLPKKWDKPLVYPRFGKKKAEVDAQDRERLRDNEFLNDNLIGFYIRFVEDHLERTNKEVAKRVYFFNSYFFATLTNTPKGKRSNYEGVQKWTRNVDIFSYDYIVVPINESAHWYVAIICNLPSLQVDPEEDGEPEEQPEQPSNDEELRPEPKGEIQEIPETPEPETQEQRVEETQSQDAVPVKEEAARQSLAEMSLASNNNPQSSLTHQAGPGDDENRPLSATNLPPGNTAQHANGPELKDEQEPVKSKKPQKSKKWTHDPRQPVIITFDSLNVPRSPTITKLRQYLSQEAKSKRGIDIDTTKIKGIKAKGIPIQDNWSDCGLYLLAYVEKFVQDPDLFMTRMLQGEMDTSTDWPPLKSGLLRYRLRGFLDDLYDEQLEVSSESAKNASLMADKQPLAYLLGPTLRNQTTAQNNAGEKPESPKPSPNANATSEVPRVEVEDSQATVVPDMDIKPIEQPTTSTSHQPEKPSKKKRNRTRQTTNGEQAQAPQSETVSTNRTKQICEEPAKKDVVEVPDSQDQDSKLLGLNSGKSKSKPAKSEQEDAVIIDDDEIAVEIMAPQMLRNDNIEVQIRGTPPPLNSYKSEKVQKSPGSNKQKA